MMKAVLKNGETLRITQETANMIAEMKKQQSENIKKADNILVRKNVIDDLFIFIDIDEVIAIYR